VSVALALAVMVLFDGLLAGFRAAAGRSGRLDNRVYYTGAMMRALGWSAVVVVLHAGLVAALVVTSASPSETWVHFVAEGATLVHVFGVFATLVLLAFGFYFAPFADFRVLTNVVVFGPLTLARTLVIVAGLGVVVVRNPDARTAIAAASAAVSMIGLERFLARRYEGAWRALVR
jgi:hypothetical protein